MENTPPHQLTPDGNSAETRSPVARLLTFGSVAAFMLGLVGIPVTGLFALDRWVGSLDMCGSDGCWWQQDSPGVTHDKLIHTLSIGGLTIVLFALAVVLGLVQMRLRRLPLGGLLPGILLVAAVMVGAAVALSSLPAARHWGVLFGVGSVVTLGVAWVQVMQLLNRARRGET